MLLYLDDSEGEGVPRGATVGARSRRTQTRVQFVRVFWEDERRGGLALLSLLAPRAIRNYWILIVYFAKGATDRARARRY